MIFWRSSPGTHQVPNLGDYDVWPFKHRHWQFDVVEDARHDCWLRTGDLRDFWPLFPDDRVLVQRYGKSVLYDRSTRTHYVPERVMKLEMRRRRPDNDRTDLLRWLDAYDHHVGEVMARKRMHRHLDERNAMLGPAPPSGDVSTQPLTAHEQWMLQRPEGEPDRVFRPEAMPLRIGWAAYGREQGHVLWLAVCGLFAGRLAPLRTGLILGFLALATQAWAVDLLLPAGLDWTRHRGRVLWSGFGLGLAGLAWTLEYLYAITRSTWRALAHDGRRRIQLVHLGCWGMLLCITPYILARNLEPDLIADWWDSQHGHAQPMEVYADRSLGRIVARGAMHLGSADALEAVVLAHPEFGLLQIESPGGFVSEGLRMAEIVRSHHLDTFTRERCASACTLVVAAGAERYYERGGLLGFHRSGLRFGPRDYSWSPVDQRIAQYFRSRGLPESFIEQALHEPMWRIWWAPEAALFGSGYITAWWSDRKPGY